MLKTMQKSVHGEAPCVNIGHVNVFAVRGQISQNCAGLKHDPKGEANAHHSPESAIDGSDSQAAKWEGMVGAAWIEHATPTMST